MSRTLKQIVYGAFYLCLLGAIGIGIYAFSFRTAATCVDQKQNQDETGIDCGGSCVPCAEKQLTPLAIGALLFFRNQDQVAVAVPIENANATHGADQIRYRFIAYDASGNSVTTISRQGFIYAQGRIYAIEAGISDDRRQISRVELVIDDTHWRAAGEWQPPLAQTRDVQIEQEGELIVINGFLENKTNSILAEVNIGAILVDTAQVPLGVSATQLQDLAPFEARAFRIFIAPEAALQSRVAPEATELFVNARK